MEGITLQNITEEDARKRLQKRGHISFVKLTLPPNQSKAMHSHPYDADIIVMQGGIKVVASGQEHNLGPGDEFQLDSGIMHTEETGNNGAVIMAAKATETTPLE